MDVCLYLKTDGWMMFGLDLVYGLSYTRLHRDLSSEYIYCLNPANILSCLIRAGGVKILFFYFKEKSFFFFLKIIEQNIYCLLLETCHIVINQMKLDHNLCSHGAVFVFFYAYWRE